MPNRTKSRVSKGEKTQQKIREAIIDLLKERNVTDFTLSDICKSASITTGAFYFHFKSKEEALEDAVTEEFKVFYKSLSDFKFDGGLEEQLKELVAKITAYHKSNGKLPRGLQATITSNPAAHEAWIEAKRPLIDRIETEIVSARSASGLKTEPSRYLAHYLLNAIEDLSMDAYQWGNPTMMRFAQKADEWNDRQVKIWSWAALAPI